MTSVVVVERSAGFQMQLNDVPDESISEKLRPICSVRKR